ncbi:MAG: phenylphosphate carboxylase subunit delta, partial [Pirellulaceae bacterium]
QKFLENNLLRFPKAKSVSAAYGTAPAKEVREVAHWVTKTPGGKGAVRELIEALLKARNRWDDLTRKYLEQ